MVNKRLITCFIAVACAFACLLSITACSSQDEADLVGEWKVQNTGATEVTVVFTGTEYKMFGNTFEYALDPNAHTITFTQEGATGTAKYEFRSNGQQLVIEESDGAGGTKTTTFDKVSSNGGAEPTAKVVEEDVPVAQDDPVPADEDAAEDE